MRDFEVRPLAAGERPGAPGDRPAELLGDEPASLSFGDDRDDRPDLVGRLRRVPGLRTLIGRPLPRVAVALISAVVTGTAVAVYLQPAEPAAPPPAPLPVLEPESWVDVRESRMVQPRQLDPEERERVDRELARHPSDALIAAAISVNDMNLYGFPPGAYEVRLTCRVPAGADPVSIGFDMYNTDPGSSGPTMEIPCDGELQVRPEALTVTGYQAYSLYYYPITDSHEDPLFGADSPVVVVSFTPLD